MQNIHASVEPRFIASAKIEDRKSKAERCNMCRGALNAPMNRGHQQSIHELHPSVEPRFIASAKIEDRKMQYV